MKILWKRWVFFLFTPYFLIRFLLFRFFPYVTFFLLFHLFLNVAQLPQLLIEPSISQAPLEPLEPLEQIASSACSNVDDAHKSTFFLFRFLSLTSTRFFSRALESTCKLMSLKVRRFIFLFFFPCMWTQRLGWV